MFSNISTSILEKALNTGLRLSPIALPEMAKLESKIIQFEFTAPPFSLYFIPNEQGELQIYSHYETPADVCISGSIIAFSKSLFIKDSSQQFFSGELKISGEMSLAHQFGAVLAGLDIDWEEQFSRLFGDQIAYQGAKRVKQLKQYASQSRKTLDANIEEYLTEESHLLPTAYEVSEFCREVDTIRNDTERLEARINLLTKQLPLVNQ